MVLEDCKGGLGERKGGRKGRKKRGGRYGVSERVGIYFNTCCANKSYHVYIAGNCYRGHTYIYHSCYTYAK